MIRYLSFLNLRARLLILVFISVVPALLFLLYNASEQKHDAEAEIRAETLQSVKYASAHIEQLAEGSRQFLAAFSELPSVLNQDPAACNEFVSRLRKDLPIYRNVFAVKPDGDLFCSALHPERKLNVADRHWFQRIVQTRSYNFGEYHIGRITSAPTICAGMPVIGGDGKLKAVVAAGFDLNSFNAQLSKIKIPKAASIFVVDRDGTILTRYPDPEAWIGKKAMESDLVKTILARKEGSLEALGLGGRKRIFSFASVKGTGDSMYVCMGISPEAAFSSVNKMLLRNMLWLLAVALMASVAAWFGADIFVLRRMKQLAAATDELASGNLGARVGIAGDRDEIGQLGRSFNQMASALKEARSDLERRVEERTVELSQLNDQLMAEIETRKLKEEELTALANELKISNNSLNNFTHVISHDLKSPLLTIGGFVNLLSRRYKNKLDARADEILDEIVKGVDRMVDLIRDLLDYSQAKTRKQQFRHVDCSYAVREAIRNLNAQIEVNNAELVCDGLPIITADESQMISLFQNLIDNAVKYRSAETPRIIISAEQKGTEWIFSVEDNGIGIDSKGLDRIFGMFQRLSTDKPGTGIGLATCKEIVERHGGRIWAQPNPESGSTFFFTIPVANAVTIEAGLDSQQ